MNLPIHLQFIIIGIVIIGIIPGAIIGTGFWIMLIMKKQEVSKKFRSIVLVFVFLSILAILMEISLILQKTSQ